MWDAVYYIQRIRKMLDWQLESESIRCQVEIDRHGNGLEREKKRYINAEKRRRELANIGSGI